MQVARIQLTRAENRLDGAREEARLAKRRRKEARKVERRARKEVKRAKNDLSEAEEALAAIEVRLVRAREQVGKSSRAVRAVRRSGASNTGRKRSKRVALPDVSEAMPEATAAVAKSAEPTEPAPVGAKPIEPIPGQTAAEPSAPGLVDKPEDA